MPCCFESSMEIDWSKAAKVLARLKSRFGVLPVALSGQEMDCSASIHSSQHCFESKAASSEKENRIKSSAFKCLTCQLTFMHSS